MRTTEQYTIENKVEPLKIEVPELLRVLDPLWFLPVSTQTYNLVYHNNERKEIIKTDESYPIRETDYDELIRQGFQFRLVALVEPGVKGWYNPITKEAVGEDPETRLHETNHHRLLIKYPRTANHEQENRQLTRNMLNYQGTRSIYHE